MKNYTKEEVKAINEDFYNFLKEKGLIKEEPKKGWYTHPRYTEWIVYFDNGYKYGFDSDGEWTNNIGGNSLDRGDIPATKKEVETALIKEAKKRGFKYMVEFHGLTPELENQEHTTFIENKFNMFIYDANDNSLDYNGAVRVFKDGKWATIVEETKQMTVSEVEKQLGYKVEIIS